MIDDGDEIDMHIEYVTEQIRAERDAAIARAEAAEALAERLREAAGPFAAHYEPWMDEYQDDTKSITFPRHTFGQIRKLRAALEPASKEDADGR